MVSNLVHMGCQKPQRQNVSTQSIQAQPTAPKDIPKPTEFKGQEGSILYVTQTPIGGLDTIVSHFTNHMARVDQAPRGGDLMIRYPDGSTRNLTREAGFGEASAFQGDKSIAVRQPTVHWDGNKALFSMAIGSVTQRYSHKQNNAFRWQIYEIEGLGKSEKVQIKKVANQPKDANNIAPIYGSDDRVIFISDQTPGSRKHLYPQLDEYEAQPVNTGIWSIVDGKSQMIEHSPSGVFQLLLDSTGRIIYTKWDHLQRDQMGDKPTYDGTGRVLTFDNESPTSSSTNKTKGTEFFPEARSDDRIDYDPGYSTHKFNQFYPWQVNQDGSEEETLNHIGRHEWGGSYTDGNFTNDASLKPSINKNAYTKATMQLPGDGGLFFINEDPKLPGRFYGVRAKEFGTGNAGSLVSLDGRPETSPEQMALIPLTPAGKGSYLEYGRYRNFIKLSDGKFVASHTEAPENLENKGTLSNPNWNYKFRIKKWDPNAPKRPSLLTIPSKRTLKWYTPDQEASWSGEMWELDPTEVRPRPRPPLKTATLPKIEKTVFDEVGVDQGELKNWLRSNELALITGRNVLRLSLIHI